MPRYFASPGDINRAVARAYKAPARIPVSEAAASVVRIHTPGGYSGPLDLSLTPYMREPLDTLNSREFDGAIFCGPAQSGKTQTLIDSWVGYTAVYDPADMLILQTSQESARDFSRRRVDRLIRYSPEIAAQMSTHVSDDNVYDKRLACGSILSIGWPSINILSGRAIPRLALTDYDRMPASVDNEGPAFDLALKRATTFLSRGMIACESSPGFPITDPQWRRLPGSHEAPPVEGGVLALFNRGDRRLYFWKCPHCHDWFEPRFELLQYDAGPDLIAASKSVVLPCSSCGAILQHKEKRALNQSARWFREGELTGKPRTSNFASFWLNGTCAAFQSWESLVLKYLQAREELDRSGSEQSLQVTTNVDQGMPYLPAAMTNRKSGDDLMKRAEDTPPRTVPAEAKLLITTVDVQSRKFVVQTQAFGSGSECWLVHRRDIVLSDRKDSEGRHLPIDPAANAEDWDLLTPLLLETYPLPNGDLMGVSYLACDSGGEDGVTDRSLFWWRRLGNLRSKVRLVKGEGHPFNVSRPLVREEYPNAAKYSKGPTKGDVPILFVHTNAAKDIVSNRLAQTTPGSGYVHIPFWFGPWVGELLGEYRDVKGWRKVANGVRNESLDLMVYAVSVLEYLGASHWKPDWSALPPALVKVYPKPEVGSHFIVPAAPPPKRMAARKSSYLSL